MADCLGCYRTNINGYCAKCLSDLFNGKKIDYNLSFSRPEYDRAKLEQSAKFSISGIQTKHSLKIEGNKLVLTETGGEYILKPIPNGVFENLDIVPINEHLTMQIAKQIFKLNVMPNALVKFLDGDYAYITKRFDVREDGNKLLQEDMAQIAGRTEETNGKNYKYDFTYEEVAELIKLHVAAYPIEVEKYFKSILYNYLIANGDAHLKNFSLYRNKEYGDYLLTPSYDLLNTSMHVPSEPDLALDLFQENYSTEAYNFGNKYTYDDFFEFGQKIGIGDDRITKLINLFLNKNKDVEILVNKSMFTNELKNIYLQKFIERYKRVNYSHKIGRDVI